MKLFKSKKKDPKRHRFQGSYAEGALVPEDEEEYPEVIEGETCTYYREWVRPRCIAYAILNQHNYWMGYMVVWAGGSREFYGGNFQSQYFLMCRFVEDYEYKGKTKIIAR